MSDTSRVRILALSLHVGVCGLAALAAACDSTQAARPRQREAVPVQVAAVVRKTVPVSLRAIGNVEARSTVSIRTRVDGELTAVLFKEGDEVRAGQLLFTIDPRPYRAALDQAKSNLAKDRAILKNAEAEAARAAALFQRGIVSKEQNDLAQAGAESAGSTVRADEAAVENATLNLGFCEIRSPITGRTGSLLVHAGNLVKGNDQSPLVIINEISPISVLFSVPEQTLSEIQSRLAARRIAVQAFAPNQPAPLASGVLTFTDNAIDATTGTVKIKASFENREHRLWPGQFVNVEVRLSEDANALVVPSQAIQSGQAGQFVFLVRPDMTVEARNVVSNRQYEGEAVVETGLEPGDRVVTDGQLRLAAGTRVRIATEKAAAPQS